MDQLNFPSYDFSIRESGDTKQIFDDIRKKWIVLTPEEWVRQHVVQFLITEKGYPAGLIAVEKGLKVNNLPKRFDIVLFDQNAKPLMTVECKAPKVKIDNSTLEQALRYNSVLGAKYLLLTNGMDIFCGEINFSNASFSYLNDIPAYTQKA